MSMKNPTKPILSIERLIEEQERLCGQLHPDIKKVFRQFAIMAADIYIEAYDLGYAEGSEEAQDATNKSTICKKTSKSKDEIVHLDAGRRAKNVTHNNRSVMTASVEQVVVIKVKCGDGTEEDPIRYVTECWSTDGVRLAIGDPNVMPFDQSFSRLLDLCK